LLNITSPRLRPGPEVGRPAILLGPDRRAAIIDAFRRVHEVAGILYPLG
jgi:hypothetical protein